ncbi:hypothetical protein HBH70_023750 [Parastagonospora nodorum]|uniref:Uncharacterized protein n=1 Tax=Phaeosphaeria nodorum (strain SN15 / ATCC MYA-4574 / FGSC 10173) TaxID=321614 RepID=A0A7U2F5N4_PHANO|nr:hypothetical protein HBH54_244600 [Parastagonospora nodorum]QRC96950.1 hypothetical protein JI435_018220 [Parastagonospora nodorum SN15]KAH3956919.1 hypothetical protein HBH51_232590 [Parastagonospora nodorum]KAH3958582.1 hypothetical protein HBH52_250510 [Parastagonospora nodorum]KAH4008011.1 hypothetical protein HBI10_000530 [Parastagonospora nodorum]
MREVATMSGADRPEPAVETTRSLKRKNLSQEDQEELDAMDKIFKRIKTAVPPTPYILSAPSMNPYHYHSQQEANAWMLGRLFKPDEAHLQYRTYVYREPCQDCLELQAGEDEEPEPERPASRASNTGGPVKKKLNLANFKVKPANGTSALGAKKASPTLIPANAKQEQTNGVKRPDKQDQKAESKIQRKHGEHANEARDKATAARTSHADSGPAKRPRSPSRKTDAAESKVDIDKSGSSDRTPHGLPPLLSPVHIPSGNPHGLPDILSPTLPSSIQTELDKMETRRKRAESSASSSSTDRKSQTLAVPGTKALKPTETVKTEPKIRTVQVNGKSPRVEAAKSKEDGRVKEDTTLKDNARPKEETKPKEDAKPQEDVKPQEDAKSKEDARPKEDADPSLVVKFKFSKAKVSTVTQLLKLAPKRNNAQKKERLDVKEPLTSSQSQTADDEPKKKKPIPKVAARRPDNTTPVSTPTIKSTTANPPTKVAEKRPRAEDDVGSAVPSKRPRAASTQDRPHTPLQQVTHSPSKSTKSSAQKGQPQYATPKNNHKTMSMLRTASTDSNDSTPGRSVATPAGLKQEGKGGPTSAPLNDKKQADFNLLNQTSMKLNQMGRALKHEATKILMAGGGKAVPKQEEKRAAVTNMECILSYMAAYHAQDASLNLRGRAGEVEGTWKTLLPLCLSYARSTKEFKHLDGLRSYLSSVIASAICTHVSQRSSLVRPHDSPHDLPHSDLAKQHATLAANFAMLSDHTNKMNQHYQDARIALPAEDIQSMYKKTFAGREANAKLAKEPEKVNGARMSGPYFLPIANDTTPIQAVRFGLKFLAEYCEKEKLEYNLRVNLDKGE